MHMNMYKYGTNGKCFVAGSSAGIGLYGNQRGFTFDQLRRGTAPDMVRASIHDAVFSNEFEVFFWR